MTRIKLLLLLCLLMRPTLGRAEDQYGYPIPGSYAATIMGTPPQLRAPPAEKISTKELVVTVIPDLKKPEIFFYDKGLRCTLAYQKKKAPLVFLIAGTGSNHKSDKLVAMTHQLYKAGYHVITLPSPTHPNFIINASHSHVPGDLREDAADLYGAMQAVWNDVKDDIEVTDVSVMGYSLGATQAAFVAKLDEDRRVFNFRKVLMINPAVSLIDSITRIEATLDEIPGGPQRIGEFFNQMLERFTEFYRLGDFIGIDNDFLYAVYKADLVNQEEAGGLIGLSFRLNSGGMIFVSDVMTNGGYIVPKNRVLHVTDPLGDYFRVGIRISFLQYFDEYFYPHFLRQRPGLTKEALLAEESLESIEGYLKASPKIGVLTNENDFILAPAEIDYLRQVFGERLKLYPRGGHLGNVEYRENMAYMQDFVGVLSQ